MFDLIWLFLIESCFQDQGDLNIGQGCCGLGGEGHSLLKYECGYYNLMTAAAAPAEALLHTTNYWQYTAVTVKCPPPYMIEIQTQETKEFELKKKYTICVLFDICLCRLTKKFHGYFELHFTLLYQTKGKWVTYMYIFLKIKASYYSDTIHTQTDFWCLVFLTCAYNTLSLS